MASYCLCGKPYDPNIFMMQCDYCKDWFHGSCCDFEEYTAIEIDKYHCPRCISICGPSLYKPYRNWHRHDYWDENTTTKPVQTGTPVFIKELRTRHFASEGEVVLHVRGQQLTETLLQQQGFNNPIVIDGKDGLDMLVPPEGFSFYDVESYIGSDLMMDVIDVTRQCDVRMKLGDFISYFNSLNRSRIFNVVSLEFSNTSLSRLVEAPLIARKLDWVNTVWPHDYHVPKPQVQKYCLMSVKDSYTDFHIDFGGTSVWYHVSKGEKIFYFIRPSPANLTLYQQWMTSSNQSETFFGDQVDQCYKCILRQGQTMIIPTGWIHAVLTPVDSLVFGGNFLHSLNIPMQLQIYDIERKVKTAKKFRFPHFETINWFAARHLLQQITYLNIEEKKCPNTLLTGLKALLTALKLWNTEKDYNISTREQIPYVVNPIKLIKDISKEVRHAERYLNTLNPPKPERESKRKRKRPVNKDFVDYSVSSKSTSEDVFLREATITNHNTPAPIRLTLPKPSMYPYDRLPTVRQEANVNQPSEQTWTASVCQRKESDNRTVLKLTLGLKNSQHSEHSDLSYVEGRFKLPSSSNSVYDFHDESDRDEECRLSIDESTTKKTKKQVSNESHKMHLPQNIYFAKKNSKSESDVDVVGDSPKNGIDSLLKASALTNKFDDTGRTSPSTQEAIAGMLSISQAYIQPERARKFRSPGSPPDEENLSNVHQDEDYIYPSLDNSDDEEFHIFKPRGRSKVDEAWNPKARVGPLLPKMNRPAREGTKKQAVEKVLEAAAAKRANESPEKSPKRQYKRKKSKQKTAVVSNRALVPSTSASTSASNNNTPLSTTVTTSKPRKGMKTAKQRLSKILKMHKMRH